MATGFSAVRSGIIMFVIPFVFAMYPELLIIEDAVLDPSVIGSDIAYLPGYDGTVNWQALAWLCARMCLALYLLASALARFDRRQLATWEWITRLMLAALIMFSDPSVYGPALVAGIAILVFHTMQGRKGPPLSEGQSA